MPPKIKNNQNSIVSQKLNYPPPPQWTLVAFFLTLVIFQNLTALFDQLIQSGIIFFHNYFKKAHFVLSELVIGKIRENLMKMVELPPSGPLSPPPLGRTQLFRVRIHFDPKPKCQKS